MVELRAWTAVQPRPLVPAHFREVFEHAPLPTIVVDLDDRVVHANEAACRLTGYQPEELMGRAIADLAHPDDRQATLAAQRSVAEGTAPAASVEARLARADGRRIWAAISYSATAGAGRPYLVVQLVDVTEQKRAERELVRSNAELSSFAYLAAHELKSPLQILSGFAALLDRAHGPQLDPQAREFVGWIMDGAGRMDRLIEDLLGYCSVDSDDVTVVPVALGDAVGEALGQLEHEIQRRDAILIVDRLPSVAGDPVQMVQLFRNLLANALKFVPDDRRPQLRVWAQRGVDAWTVTVADNGIGVEDGARERIFAMFERLHPRERFKGTGIGLAICKRIVERRGGTIWVEPNPSGGSRFRFVLPDGVEAAPASPVQ